jgi:SAM-dependent methyltransferase
MLLKHLAKRGRFLDVGCASGQLIFHLQQLGWEVGGVEVNEGVSAIARFNNLPVHVGTLDTYNDRNKWDAIYLGDVVEHLPNPYETLILARKLLKERGLLVLRTPNSQSGYARVTFLLSRLFRLPWIYSEAPYHLCDWSVMSLTALTHRMGFTVQEFILAPARLPFFYSIGASGLCDDLKAKLKRKGRYALSWGALRYIHDFLAAAVLVSFSWTIGTIFDVATRTSPYITVIAAPREPSQCT